MKWSIFERARRYIAKCPHAISGQGGHNATYHVAAVLVHRFGLSANEALALLREWNDSCHPPWSESELVHKIQSAEAASHQSPRGHLLGTTLACPRSRAKKVTPPPKPKFCPMVLSRVAAKAGGIPDMHIFLANASPVAVLGLNSADVLRLLYPKGTGERVLIFSNMKSQGQLLWESDACEGSKQPRLPAGKDGVWFLPQPVDGAYHPNPRHDGKLSRRSEESVTAWRYAVLESDEAGTEEWLRCLVQMPLRIASICESGSRSIHALVRLNAVSKSDWDAQIGSIKRVLVTLGADAGALSAVRLTRLPQAARGERMQRLLYMNPKPEAGPIWNGGAKGKACDE